MTEIQKDRSVQRFIGLGTVAGIARQIGLALVLTSAAVAESGEVVVARSGLTARFPARFTLVLAANPCPCAKGAATGAACSCTPATKRRYLSRLSGPLLDRVDVKVELLPVGRAELLNDRHGVLPGLDALCDPVLVAGFQAGDLHRLGEW